MSRGHSEEADVFSFAMVMVRCGYTASRLLADFSTLIQIFIGEISLHPLVPAMAILAVLGRKRPARPTDPDLMDELWALLELGSSLAPGNVRGFGGLSWLVSAILY